MFYVILPRALSHFMYMKRLLSLRICLSLLRKFCLANQSSPSLQTMHLLSITDRKDLCLIQYANSYFVVAWIVVPATNPYLLAESIKGLHDDQSRISLQMDARFIWTLYFVISLFKQKHFIIFFYFILRLLSYLALRVSWKMHASSPTFGKIMSSKTLI